ncbi:MAG: tetraacyldisaccharide 4'-kinase [Bacteroidia bacterium]|nr:tetraacyldisaccharide 4'-kinase [Bacteroidia bacterium]
MNTGWLKPFSALYGLVLAARNRAYDRGRGIYRAPVPVISIGNLSAGGTGKTPMAAWMLDFLRQQGVAAAYLSRGYGRSNPGYHRVDPEFGRAWQYGDEALMIARRFPDLPVAVSESRRTGIARLLREAAPPLIVLDDAFQHRRVARSLDLVVLDAGRMPWDDRLLPAGRLREPISSLSRADLLIINKLDDPAEIPELSRRLESWGKPLVFSRPRFETLHIAGEEPQPAEALRGQTAVLCSGIGNPAYFRRQTEAAGVQIAAEFAFPDHHPFSPVDLRRVREAALAAGPDALVLTTEKDAVRLQHHPSIGRWSRQRWGFVRTGQQFWQGEAVLQTAVSQLLR